MLDPLYQDEPPPPAPRARPLLAWIVNTLIRLAVVLVQFVRKQLAWIAITLMVVVIVLFQISRKQAEQASGKDTVNTLLVTMQGRYLVGATSLLGASSRDLYSQALQLDTGTVGQRLRFVTLAGELAGPQEALRQLDELRRKLDEHQVQPTATETASLASLEELYTDYHRGHLDAPSLDEQERQELRQELGWFGELALAPPNGPQTEARAEVMREARTTTWAVLAIIVAGLLALLAGFVGLVIFFVLLVMRQLRGGLGCGELPHAGVYAETFALWMFLFAGLMVAGSLIPAGDFRMLVSAGTSLLSLVALAWPVYRGVPWQQVRQDIGWTAGRRSLLEPLFGAVCYVISLPLLLAAVLMMMALTVMLQRLVNMPSPADNFAPNTPPSHPVVEVVARAGWWGWIQIFFLAAVVAPVIEETMFRGVLYRQLREASCRYGPTLSVIVSGTLVGFVFAVIHPQGLLAVPLLMALAYGFTIAREWRGTLLPAMVAHGINNGLVTLFLIVVLGN